MERLYPKEIIDADSITAQQIWEARKRISPIIQSTPLIKSPVLSEIAQASVYLKLENTQDIGAFKIRGAANKILSLTAEEKQRGVTTFSTGNHGLAVAYVANRLGIRAVICISERVPKAKVDAIKQLGAELKIEGHGQDDAAKNCYKLRDEQGLTIIEPFDDPHIIAGQGTIGLELLEDLPEIDTAIVPLSGGGLLAGIGVALKSNNPNIEVVGVSMEKSAVMYESLKVGKPIELKEEDTLADSLLGGIGLENKYTFPIVQQYMDFATLIPETSIASGMAFMFEKHRMVVEGAAATGVAAILDKKLNTKGKNIGIIITGNNVDLSVIFRITHHLR
jgi:threonine dehydratase